MMPLYITVHNTGRQCVEQTEKKKKKEQNGKGHGGTCKIMPAYVRFQIHTYVVVLLWLPRCIYVNARATGGSILND